MFILLCSHTSRCVTPLFFNRRQAQKQFDASIHMRILQNKGLVFTFSFKITFLK